METRGAAARLMPGAQPIRIERGRAGACLLLHGWLSTPADFGSLPHALDEAGWDVHAPLHPGHGTCPADLEGVTAQGLLDASRRHYAALRGRYRKVALVGFSMGGTLATMLAAEQPPDRLVLVAPFYSISHRWYYVLPAHWWHAMLAPFLRRVRRPLSLVRVNRPEGRADIIAYGAFPIDASTALFELRETAASTVVPSQLHVPVLVAYSPRDRVASPAAIEAFFNALPEGTNRTALFPRSDHWLLHDYDRQEAAAAIVDFLGTP